MPTVDFKKSLKFFEDLGLPVSRDCKDKLIDMKMLTKKELKDIENKAKKNKN